MNINTIIPSALLVKSENTQLALKISSLKKEISQQERNGEAALKLIKASEVPLEPAKGGNIDITV